MKYVALLRGINVGGNRKVPMAELKACLEKTGLENVKTYIQSGNVIFESDNSEETLIEDIESAIEKSFGFEVPIVLMSKPQLEKVLQQTPSGWLENAEWKYNYLFFRRPYDMKQIVKDIGDLKPDVEAQSVGDGVVYQSMSIKKFGTTTAGKMIGKPVYKQMTIRNHNTVTKLLALMNQ
jgi:uncharacterized protein (DUF1697 family)